jgi:lysine-N-methylase
MNKKKINVMTPKFASDFACVGSECESHCCNSWDVGINKKAYKALKKHGDIEIRQLAASTFKLTRQSENEYANIKMSENGDCPILDKNNLCTIHKKCGSNLLPHVCQDYPRTPRWFGNQAEMSMVLSCPEVAKNVLYDPEAMMITSIEQYENELNHGDIGGLTAENLPNNINFIRDFCFSVALNSELKFEQQLFIIGLYLKQSDSHLNDPKRLSQLADNFNIMIKDGTLVDSYNSLPIVPAVKWKFFSAQDTHLVLHHYESRNTPLSNIKKFDAFLECQQMLMNSFNDNKKIDDIDGEITLIITNPERDHQKYTEILASSEVYINDHFQEHPQLLINFLLYSLYHDKLMATSSRRPYEYFKTFILDVLMLKSYLSGIAFQNKTLTKEWVIKLFHSYFRRRQHNPRITNQMNKYIKEAEEQSEYMIFSLLKS